jgi:opacity protein-like surface antigen
MKKTDKIAIATALAVAAVSMAAPGVASAHSKHHAKHAKHGKHVKHARHAKRSHVSRYETSSYSAQSATSARLEQMESELAALRSELAKNRAETQADVKAVTDAHAAAVDEKLAAHEKLERNDFLFFRGGYAKMEHARNNELLTANSLLGISQEKDGEGWYVGAGFDHNLTHDVWGLWGGASVDGEVMFEYKNYGTSTNTLVTTYPLGTDLSGAAGTMKNKVTQFTLTASPKIKFNDLGDFRPWIIPFGLAIHVISPPSSGVTVLNPGLMVGAGAEYRIWEDLFAGLDFRYHWTGNDLNFRSSKGLLNKVDTDGFTTGAYLGFGF